MESLTIENVFLLQADLRDGETYRPSSYRDAQTECQTEQEKWPVSASPQ